MLKLIPGTCAILFALALMFELACAQQPAAKIVLVAGETAKQDTMGHHDYIAGCKCLDLLLKQTTGVTTEVILEGWPAENQAEKILGAARSIVFYTDGGGKQAFMKSPERIALMQSLVNRGVGIVMIHQAVDYPNEMADQAKSWLGGIYLNGASGRGHWPSKHVDFPQHPVSRGVTPWEVNDGWLNGIQFTAGLKGVTPLVWSGKQYAGSRAGLDPDVVGWVFQRPEGGRSFSFTGLDAHSAWSLTGLRQLVVNGVLWSAGIEVPQSGAPCAISENELQSLMTPRQPKRAKAKAAKSAE